MIIEKFMSLVGELGSNPAYLDPGSGSFILQILAASLLAGLLFIKTFWRRITGVFRKPGVDDEEDPADDRRAEDEENRHG